MSRRGEGAGIGVFGVFVAIFLILIVHDCAQDTNQDWNNRFCESKGFDYGAESVRNTAVTCSSFNSTTVMILPYSDREAYRICMQKKEHNETC